jgi:Leucine-rich repeat (LRR) protein
MISCVTKTVESYTYAGGLSEKIGVMTQLRVLRMQQSGVTSLPSAMSKLINLQEFNVQGAKIVGDFPSVLTKLKSLSVLILAGNKLKNELPSSISNMKSLTYLDLSRNSFTGKLPSSIEKLTSLVELHLYSNGFTGQVPKLYKLTSLAKLNLGDNYFTKTFLNPLPGSFPGMYEFNLASSKPGAGICIDSKNALPWSCAALPAC